MKNTIVLSAFFLGLTGLFYGVSAHAQTAPPVWYQIGTQTINTGQGLTLTVYASSDTGVTYAAINLPSGATFDPYNHLFSWKPVPSQTGSYTVTLRATNAVTSSDMTFTVQVLNPFSTVSYPNPAPYYGGSGVMPTFTVFNPPTTAHEGQLYTYTVQAVSNNNNALTYRVIAGPAGFTINPTLGIIIWVPDYSQGKTDPYTVVIGASNGQFEATKSYSVTVQDVSDGTASAPPSGFFDQFTSPPPAPAPAPIALKISDLKATKENGEIVITWTTNLSARDRVIYDTESQADKTSDFTYKSATPDSEDFVTSHKVVLKESDLDGGKTYYFRAVSKTKVQTAVSDEMQFSTDAKGLGLVASFTALLNFLTAHWVYVLIAIVIIIFFYRRFRKKSEEGASH